LSPLCTLLPILLFWPVQAEGSFDKTKFSQGERVRPPCISLKPGEEAVVRFSEESSPTGLPAAYRLSRTSEQEFLVELRMDFVRDSSYAGTLSPVELHEHFHKKAQQCLSSFRQVLKSADRRLEIRLSDSLSVPGHTVRIGARDMRSNSKTYAESASCTTILHEVLHLLGLPDEYEETAKGFRYDEGLGRHLFVPENPDFSYTCRRTGPEASVMSWHQLAFANATPMEVWAVEQCECAEGENCEEKADNSLGYVCPPGTKPSTGEQHVLPGSGVNEMITPSLFVLVHGRHRKLRLTKEFGSILYPAHIRAITEPGCENVNRCYYACSRNAYRFQSPVPRPGDSHPASGCLPVPEDCNLQGCLK
jgi:hypothetical protein